MQPYRSSCRRTRIERLCDKHRQIDGWRWPQRRVRVESGSQKGRSALGVLARVITATRALQIFGHKEIYLTMACALYLLTRRGCPFQTVIKGFEARQSRSPRFFVLVLWLGAIRVFDCSASHSYVHYPIAGKEHYTELLSLEELVILKYFVPVIHWYLSHGRRAWWG